MVVLRKIKASTLMETLVASILIIVIFMIASMILNNLFFNNVKSDTGTITNNLIELEYLCLHKKITVPYLDNIDNWSISINHPIDNQDMIIVEAINKDTEKTILRHVYIK